MTLELVFTVEGSPASQGSLSAHVVKGRVRIHNDSRKTAPWRALVSARAREAMPAGWEAIDAPVAVKLLFHLAPPMRPRFRRPAVKPDLDKLVRAVLDSLTDAGVWRDDSRVVDLAVSAWYADELNPAGVDVEVRRA